MSRSNPNAGAPAAAKLLTDLCEMPFGKFKGEPMMKVPASYLHYLWTNGLRDDKRSPVAEYIRRNLDALRHENADAIWTLRNTPANSTRRLPTRCEPSLRRRSSNPA